MVLELNNLRYMRFSISLIFIAFFFPNLIAQSAWTKLDKSGIDNYRSGNRIVTPTAYSAFTLDMDELKKDLKKVSDRDFSKTRRNKDIIEVPFPDGKMVSFDVWNAPVMAPKLAAKYPNIKSYKALSEDGNHVMRFIVSKDGFNGVISSSEGTIYLDPIFPDNPKAYQSYYIKDQEEPDPYWKTCGTHDTSAEQQTTPEDISRSVAAIPIRTYRMAIACTGEYGQIVGGTVEDVLVQFNLAASRLSQIYELNIAVNFMLIDDIERIIHLDPNSDPYFFPAQGRELIGENSAAINGLIPQDSYDIGHVFTRGCTDGVAGIAALGSLCSFNKANGVSCVGGSNITSFASNVIAHEIGHQFSASHSWNHCPGSEDQMSAGWAYEPGSGSTIMSYAGLCGSSNTGVSDDYFSAGSLLQMTEFSREQVGGCGLKTDELNNEPVIDMPYENGFFIPMSTPFELDASATDEDGDVLFYGWDQYNLGPTSPLGSPQGNAPSFISVAADEESNRFFPRIQWVRANLDRDIEILPDYERDLTFRFVVRDQNPIGTATVWEELEMHVAGNSGPFLVTQPNINPDGATVGQELEVRWDVSNTDQEPVNCQLVDILLSTDDGRTFDRVLVRNTPNDGEQVVRIPNAQTLDARIKVQSVGNVFYDMGNSGFVIEAPTEPSYIYELSNNFFDVCAPASPDLEIQSSAFLGYAETVEFDISEGLPTGVTPIFSESSIQPDGSTSLSFDITDDAITGNYEVTLRSISGTDTIEQPIFLNITATDFSDLALSFPVNGSSGVEQFPTFQWEEARNAENYIFELATSPAFGASTVEFNNNVTTNSFEPTSTLEKSTLYYWRVTPNNKCFAGEPTRLNTFGTVALSCRTFVSEDGVKNISASGSGDFTVTKEAFVAEEGQVSAVAVKKVSGDHQRFSNLVFSLESPAGTRAIMVSNECGSTNDNFNCGFEDSSPITISCPFNETYQPEEPLSIFNGESTQGSWYFHINDQTVGAGGTFEEFELQVCSSETLDAPFLVNNNTLGVFPGSWVRVETDYLLVEDANNTSEELIYTVVDLPTSGRLEIEGEVAVIGSQYTQKNINGNQVRYYSEDESATSDQFTFTCIDGEGGWIDITSFNIEIDDSFTSDVEDILELVDISIVPNPVKESSIITINNTNGKNYNLSLTNLNGQVFSQSNYTGDTKIEISVKDYPAGIYFISIESAGSVNYEKMVVVK